MNISPERIKLFDHINKSADTLKQSINVTAGKAKKLTPSQVLAPAEFTICIDDENRAEFEKLGAELSERKIGLIESDVANADIANVDGGDFEPELNVDFEAGTIHVNALHPLTAIRNLTGYLMSGVAPAEQRSR